MVFHEVLRALPQGELIGQGVGECFFEQLQAIPAAIFYGCLHTLKRLRHGGANAFGRRKRCQPRRDFPHGLEGVL